MVGKFGTDMETFQPHQKMPEFMLGSKALFVGLVHESQMATISSWLND